MTGVKISTLPWADAATDTDQLEVNQGGTSKRVTTGQVAALIASSDQIAAAFVAASDRLSPSQFGAAMDGVTDDTAAFEALMAAAANSGRAIDLGSGHAILSRQITVPPDIAVTYGHCTLDWSAVAAPGSVFPQKACLYIAGDAPVQISDLGVNAAAGDNTLTLAAPETLADGDVVMIHDPTDSSYSGFRPYYRAGEMAQVHKIVGNLVTLYSPLYAAYIAATVNVYRLTRKTSSFNGGKLTIKGSTALNISYGIRWEDLYNPIMQNIEVYNANMICMAVIKTWGARGSNLCARQSTDTSATGYSDYGLSLEHSQNARFYGVDLAAYKHGFTSGGGTSPAVINRDFEVHGTFSHLDVSADTIGSVSAHGNSEHYHISGTFNGGIQVGGNHGKFSGRVRNRVGDRCAVSCAELLGFDFDCSGITVEMPASNPSVDGRSIIDINGNSDAIGANTKFGGTFRLTNARVYAPAGTRALEAMNNGYIGTQRLVLDLRGMHLVAVSGTSATMLLIDTDSGTDAWTLLLDNFINEPNSTFSTTAGTKVLNPAGLKGVNLTGAATLLLDNLPSDQITVTGNPIVTAITLAEGQVRTLRFSGTPTLTAGASLIIPGGTKVVTAGSMAVVRGYAAGVVQVVSYAAA